LQERQLNLAPIKCEHLAISCSRESVQNTFLLMLMKLPLHVELNLGVIIFSDLKWAGNISCATLTCNAWTLLCAFSGYVRPFLEYNSSVWSPYLTMEQAKTWIERFHNSTTN